jgi:hypothetical protein
VETHAELALKEFYELNVIDQTNMFDLDYPALWVREKGEWTEFPHASEDVYALIQMFASSYQKATTEPAIDAVIVITCGWGAPMPEDDNLDGYSPSHSPQRERVNVSLSMTREGSQGSRLEFSNDKEPIYGLIGVSGDLATASEYLGVSVWKKRWVRGVFFEFAAIRSQVETGQLEGTTPEEVTKHYAERLANLMRFLGVDPITLDGVEELTEEVVTAILNSDILND